MCVCFHFCFSGVHCQTRRNETKPDQVRTKPGQTRPSLPMSEQKCQSWLFLDACKRNRMSPCTLWMSFSCFCLVLSVLITVVVAFNKWHIAIKFLPLYTEIDWTKISCYYIYWILYIGNYINNYFFCHYSSNKKHQNNKL